MADELLQWVDENDVPLGSVTRKESKTEGKRYRIVRFIIEDEDGNTLIQKRVATKDTYPNCWDNAAAGHVDFGESYEEAAVRELKEVAYYYSENISPNSQIMNRFTKIYFAKIPHDTEFTLQPEEVSEVRWATISEVAALASENTQISDGLLQTYERYYKH